MYICFRLTYVKLAHFVKKTKLYTNLENNKKGNNKNDNETQIRILIFFIVEPNFELSLIRVNNPLKM